MIYAYLGKDFNILNKAVNDFVSKLNIDNIIKYDYAESSLIDIIDEVNYIDLFNEKKLVIVSNFSFKKLKEDDEKLLLKYIDNMNDNIIIFKCEDESLDDRKALTKVLRKKCHVEEIEKLDYKSLHAYVTNMFKKEGIEANYNQIKRILDLCEYNPDYTISELDKLFIYKIGEKKLFDKDIEDVISKNIEKEMFTLIDNVLSKKIGPAIDSFKILVSSNVDETAIVDTIAKQFRLLMQVKLLKDKMSEVELVKTLGVNPYVIKKLIPYVNSYNNEEIANILYKLSNIDIDFKIKGYDKNKLLESFLVTL